MICCHRLVCQSVTSHALCYCEKSCYIGKSFFSVSLFYTAVTTHGERSGWRKMKQPTRQAKRQSRVFVSSTFLASFTASSFDCSIPLPFCTSSHFALLSVSMEITALQFFRSLVPTSACSCRNMNAVKGAEAGALSQAFYCKKKRKSQAFHLQQSEKRKEKERLRRETHSDGKRDTRHKHWKKRKTCLAAGCTMRRERVNQWQGRVEQKMRLKNEPVLPHPLSATLSSVLSVRVCEHV